MYCRGYQHDGSLFLKRVIVSGTLNAPQHDIGVQASTVALVSSWVFGSSLNLKTLLRQTWSEVFWGCMGV